MKKLLPFIFLLTVVHITMAQNVYDQVNFYPPSVASMMKYIDHPITPRTGVPDINIPLYTIRSGKLELPLILSFHIDDYAKVNQQPGAAGAGWSLSSDIQVSRIINNKDDFGNGGYASTGIYRPNYNGEMIYPDHNYKYKMYLGQKDEEPDKFYYKLLGKGGAFYPMRQASGQLLMKPLPINGVQIMRENGYKIVDTDGTTYYFSPTITDWSGPISNRPEIAWKCEKIVSADGADIISFSYISHEDHVAKYDGKEEIYDDIHWTSSATLQVREITRGPKKMRYGMGQENSISYVWLNEEVSSFNWTDGDPFQPQSYFYLETRSNYLSEIKFKGGKAIYTYNNNHILTQIRIFDNSGNLVKSIALTQSGNKFTRNLAKLSIGSETYDFSYGFQHEGGVFADFWGYEAFANSLSGCANVPFHSVEIVLGPDGTYANGDYPQDFSLSLGSDIYGTSQPNQELFLTIRYPTGGFTEYKCESHLFKSESRDRPLIVGGYRIGKISSYDKSSKLLKEKTYKYGVNERGTGIMRQEPLFDPEYGTCHTLQDVRYYVNYNGRTAEEAASLRLRTYLPHTTYQMNYNDGNYINYDEVAEYESDMGVATGKIVYKYNLEDPYYDPNQYADPLTPYPIGSDIWYVGVPDSVIYYKFQNGQFDWVKKVGYVYERYSDPARIFRGRVWITTIPILINNDQQDGYSLLEKYGEFTYRTGAIDLGCMLLKQEDEYTKSDNGLIMKKEVRYYYDGPNHYTLSRKEETYQTGEKIVEQILYPEDYLQDSYMQMLRSKNIVSLPVERIVRRNGKIIDGESYQYDDWGRVISGYKLEAGNLSESIFRLSNKAIAGDFGVTATSVYSIDSHYRFKTSVIYDPVGNVTQITNEGECPITYLWGYNGQYIVAEIRNRTYEQILQKLGSALINRIRQSVVPVGADMQQIANLRNEASIQVTTATYQPLVGLQSKTDPMNKTTTYQYNSFGRLIKVMNSQGKVLKEYQYSMDK